MKRNAESRSPVVIWRGRVRPGLHRVRVSRSLLAFLHAYDPPASSARAAAKAMRLCTTNECGSWLKREDGGGGGRLEMERIGGLLAPRGGLGRRTNDTLFNTNAR